MNRVQRGSVAVEFALVLLLFLTFLLGVMEFARLAYTWNAAQEAARAGARFAAVCANPAAGDTATVLARMRALEPQITSIRIDWTGETGSTCTNTDCRRVSVTVTGLQHRWVAPILGLESAPTRAFAPSYALSREAMGQDVKNGVNNSPTICAS